MKTHIVRKHWLKGYRLYQVKCEAKRISEHLLEMNTTVTPHTEWYRSKRKFYREVLNSIVGEIIWV